MRWVAWSALSSKHDFSKMRKKYDSFGRWKGARVTMASVCWHVKQQGGVVASVFDNLRDEAKRIRITTKQGRKLNLSRKEELCL